MRADHGERLDLPTTDMLEENRRLRQEVAELRRANAVPASTWLVVWPGRTRDRGRAAMT